MDRAEPRSKRTKPKASKPEKRAARGKSAGQAPRTTDPIAISPDERQRMIALAAYYRAEQRGFMNGDPMRDWLEAEAEVTMRLQEAETGNPTA